MFICLYQLTAHKSDAGNFLSETNEENSQYEELQNFNKEIYKLVDIPNIDDSNVSSDVQESASKNVESSKEPADIPRRESFSLAVDVERIAQSGCVDPTDAALEEALSTVEEEEEPRSEEGQKQTSASGASADGNLAQSVADPEKPASLYTRTNGSAEKRSDDLRVMKYEGKDDEEPAVARGIYFPEVLYFLGYF